jgi:predicted TIM-barrel fold metal-dependent hydrolase
MVLSSTARAQIERRLQLLDETRDRITVDGDTHPSDPALFDDALRQRLAADPNYYHGRPVTGEDLIREMDQAGVHMAMSWQNPAVTRYGTDPSRNFEALHAANASIAALAARLPERIIPAGWTDPKALGLEGALEMVRICIEDWGFPVVKMNPAQNAYPIDSDMVLEVVDRIVGLGAVPAFHYGADTPFTPAEGLERVALRHPDHPVIGVHMGGGGAHYVEADPLYIASRELGLRRPNIFYILSAKRDTHIESALITYALAGEPFLRNIAVGSDIPYGRITWNFGGYRGLFQALADGAQHPDPRLKRRPDLFDEAMVQGFMGRNLADLIIAADRRLLAQASAEAAA